MIIRKRRAGRKPHSPPHSPVHPMTLHSLPLRPRGSAQARKRPGPSRRPGPPARRSPCAERRRLFPSQPPNPRATSSPAAGRNPSQCKSREPTLIRRSSGGQPRWVGGPSLPAVSRRADPAPQPGAPGPSPGRARLGTRHLRRNAQAPIGCHVVLNSRKSRMA